MSALARSALRVPRGAVRARLASPRPIPHAPSFPRTAISRLSTAAAPPSGPKWNARRLLIATAVSLVAFGSAGWGWHFVENLERSSAGSELSDPEHIDGMRSPATHHDNAKYPAVLHSALNEYKAAFDAGDYSAAEAVLRGVYAAAAAMPAESFTGILEGAVGKRRVAQELAGLLAEVVILQDRVVDAWIILRDEYDALGEAPFTTWPEGPVNTADTFLAALFLAKQLARKANLQLELEEPEPFPAPPPEKEEQRPKSWNEAVMYYYYAQAAGLLDLGLAHLAPEDRRVRHAYRPAEEGESLELLDVTQTPASQEESRQHTATTLRLLGGALHRDDQRALAAQYLQLAYKLCDPASPLANHLTLLGAALAQEQLAEVAFVSEYLHSKRAGKVARFTKAIRHLHSCLALLERSEELAAQLSDDERRGTSPSVDNDEAEHAAVVTPTRMQTFYHLAMYEAVSLYAGKTADPRRRATWTRRVGRSQTSTTSRRRPARRFCPSLQLPSTGVGVTSLKWPLRCSRRGGMSARGSPSRRSWRHPRRRA
ncbi:hypothetical protein CC85DRAFT_53075 [Cutaneotrichosporon oleaginosum]|uniref:Uncharacterized protein n=1 Tax=Cutaneotrichosporon oleaginosum TaxID=879819 RepID=A0A0J1B6V5_9TREE|nr:uncharacterized protein CC85DRAFT_53075 [Cutaneotrichosporon oleaginosum]KLT43449.1 hypothetical protein CC85DRAFT_53075 [Cutaneotrichosporon oleaginosum]TXT05338.1 hypothetical protein COLE_06658 [Cutaneotrichosporon oleaginosum]